MLETYNYEQVNLTPKKKYLIEYMLEHIYDRFLTNNVVFFQTLMETCKNLMNHDIHVHLKNLTTAAKKGYVSVGDNCSLCTKQFVNQNETDTVIIFR